MRPPVTQAPILKSIETAGKIGITAANIRKQTRLGRPHVSVTLSRLQTKGLVFSYGAATRMRYFISAAFRDAAKTLMDAEESRWQAERQAKQARELIAKEERRLGKKAEEQSRSMSPQPFEFKGWHRKVKEEEPA